MPRYHVLFPSAAPWLTCGVMLLCLCAPPARGAEPASPEAQFEELFGREVQRVRTTPGFSDDLRLADSLLEAARNTLDRDDLAAVLCRRAHALAAEAPAGFDTAREAMALLAERLPSAELEALQTLIELHQQAFTRAAADQRATAGEALIEALLNLAEAQTRAGQASEALKLYRRAHAVAAAIRSARRAQIKDLYDRSLARGRLDKQIDVLKARLQNDPGNTQHAEQLLRMYLIELDDPQEARKYSFLISDAQRKANIRLAAGDRDRLTESQQLQLADWYRSIASEAANDRSKLSMLRRARGFYDGYLEAHTVNDLDRTQAMLARRKLMDELKRLDPDLADDSADTIAAGHWVDVMDLIDPKRDARRGRWSKRGNMLVVEPDRGATLGLPLQPEGSYELHLRFARVSDGAIMVAFPVASQRAYLYLDYPHGSSGIGPIDGTPGYDRSNPTRVRHGGLKNQSAYAVGMKVGIRGEMAEVRVTLNGHPHIQWTGPVSRLGTPRPTPPAPRLLAWNCGVGFRTIRLRSLGGKLVRLDQGNADAVPSE